MKTTHRVVALIVVAGLAFSCGCGGGGGARGSGLRSAAVSISVRWPKRSAGRLIPDATNSIKVTVTDAAQAVKSAVVARPTGDLTESVTIEGLEPGPAHIDAIAVASTDGTGTPLAAGSEPVGLSQDQITTAPTLTLSSTIVSLVVTPTSITVGTGKTLDLTASGVDSSGQRVLLTGAKLNWSLSSTVASIPAHGNPVTLTAGANPGGTTLIVQDTESGKVATFPVSVTTSSAGGNVMVLDQTSIRIAFLSDAASGATDTTVSLGSKTNVFPEDMARDAAGNLYIAEGPGSSSSGGAIVKLDPSGNELGRFTPKATLTQPPNAGLQYNLVPYQIAVDPSGHIFFHVQPVDEVNGGVTYEIWRVDSISGFPSTLKKAVLPRNFMPIGMAADDTLLYVTDGGRFYGNGIDLGGSFVGPFFSPGSGTNQFNMHGNLANGANHAVTLDGNGHMYVADFNNRRLVRFDTSGFQDFNWNFTTVPLDSSLTNGATAFKPISVAVDSANQHVYFTGIEVKDPTQSDALPPNGTNVVNSLVEKMDVSSFSTGTPANRTMFGGAFTSVGAANLFGRPVSVVAK